MPILFVLFILIPIVEITVLIKVGEAIGAWYTIGLVLLSAFIGVNMLRIQGLSTLARAQQRMSQGDMPGQEMIEGIVLAVGGAMLITPGFVTDFFGFCCLIPFTRKWIITHALSRFTVVTTHQTGDSFHEAPSDPFPPESSPFKSSRKDIPRQGYIIDGEYRRED